MRKKREPVILQDIEMISFTAEGLSVARKDSAVIFVKGAVPGDIADIAVTKKKKSYWEAHVIKINKPSPDRVIPLCEHFGTCGGCKWQDLSYDAQIRHKEIQVFETLRRIGKIIPKEKLPISGAEQIYHYRNKLEYTFSNKKWLTKEEIESGVEFTGKSDQALGYHLPGRFDKVLDIQNCYLQEETGNQIRKSIKAYAIKNDLEFFDIRNQQGFLRNVIIRNNKKGEWMVLFSFFRSDKMLIEDLLTHIANLYPQIVSLLYVINPKKNDTIYDLEVQTFKGDDFIIEELGNLKFKISAKSFFQTNSFQAKRLYDITREFADLNGKEVVYDLYTGTGSIANYIADKAFKVIGIDYVEDAIKDAFINSENNNITNTHFIAGDMKEVFTSELFNTFGRPDVVITDPPRAGMHEDVVKCILEAGPEKIVYVSCNPSTQARDLQLLSTEYEIVKIQPVDMFPHTHHIENVALLIRKK